MTGYCQACGTAFLRSNRERNPRKWCSDSCRVSFQRGYRKRVAQCLQCGSAFVTARTGRTYCSRRCGRVYRARLRPRSAEWAGGRQPLRSASCLGCSIVLETRASRPLCAICRRTRRLEHSARKNFRRRSARQGEPYTLTEIAGRDNWRCHLCDDLVDAALMSPHPMSASRDHLVPLSLGGVDEASNVRLAHRVCNSRRGARILEAA